MADITREFESGAQEACYDKVAEFGKDLFGEMFERYDDRVAFYIRFGSAVVTVKIDPWRDDDTTISVSSWVITGVEMTPELMEYLVRKNFNIRFGAFSIDDEDDIHFEHTIVGSTIEKAELQASVMAVANVADSYDDEIQQRWGGSKALD